MTGIPTPELFPFGYSAGDVRGPTGDDSASNPVTLGIPLTLIGTEYSQIFVIVFGCSMSRHDTWT